ncbi:uncharacterized protein LOC106169729 [Lingula anatina]|uniref:Uncharacterized protein LOC106169729 n=1 Tax=Lingula anatina TaxID=7574 RepID=A0A1S3J4L7_LINAN|nr:uncharacterized protein LOC106169729 [Lingula anatina]|eukprot:XP_013404784.1 uncharacterized protein LOC106169729 [Lingula anatina]
MRYQLYFVLLLSYVITSCGVVSTNEHRCIGFNSCMCKSSVGIIDISALANKNGTARFRDIPSPDAAQSTVSWNPCYPFSDGTYQAMACYNVSGCVVHYAAGMFWYYSLGTQQSATFITDATRGLGIYYNTTEQGGRSLFVQLQCDPKVEADFGVSPDDPYVDNTFYFTLRSRWTCPDPHRN